LKSAAETLDLGSGKVPLRALSIRSNDFSITFSIWLLESLGELLPESERPPKLNWVRLVMRSWSVSAMAVAVGRSRGSLCQHCRIMLVSTGCEARVIEPGRMFL
jgi:hypothetical protein